MKKTDIEIGFKIRTLRQSAGLTQAQLAKKSGVSTSEIQKLESGKTKFGHVSVDRGMKIANALGVQIIDIIGY